MSQVRTSQPDLPQPLRAIGSTLRRLPGAGQVGKVADSALDWIGAVSPRGRRIAVYTGAGVLGVAGVVEWPVAITGAAIAWLTQPHSPKDTQEEAANDDGARDREPGTARSGRQSAADGPSERPGPGARLEPSHFRHDHDRDHDRPEYMAHEQPAKVGDRATTSALKQVAEASAHHHASGPPGGEAR